MQNIETPEDFINCLKQMIAFMESYVTNPEKIKKLNAPENDKFMGIKELTHLRSLVKSEIWPNAIPENYLNTEEEEAADALLKSLIKTDMFEKKVLELGCRTGLNCATAKHNFHAKKVVGYDNIDHFVDYEEVILTQSWEDVVANAPYDVIFSNETIDEKVEFDKWLEKTKSLRSSNCKVFIRCHPWCSRHGANLHKQLNKAFLNVVFSPEELFTLGVTPKNTRKFLNPIEDYKAIFQKTGYSIESMDEVKSDIENLFENSQIVSKRIKQHWKKTDLKDYEFPRTFLEYEAIDFTLI
jgi:hypothetical protein